ncbi:hypothetical protein DEO72_LG7g2812 [Vigna unguiculata]|uniref:Uncharacterized protein n=1 Tax=Vigna unguiculata TaxID=3917 RepID=A0A4D6ML57_VIGUN|nr:hypothetical protein DEO72_LG7g2812 [Vigna unguiculata]
MVQKNGSNNQIPNKYESLGVNSEASQHRSKNYPHLINFMQGVKDVKTQSMVPYASSSSSNITSRTTTKYDQVLKFGYQNILSPPSQIDSIKNFMQEKSCFTTWLK